MRVLQVSLPHEVIFWEKYIPRIVGTLTPKTIFVETGSYIPDYITRQLEILINNVCKGLSPKYFLSYARKKGLPRIEYLGTVCDCLYLSGKEVFLERVPKICGKIVKDGMDHWFRAIRSFFSGKFEKAAKDVRKFILKIDESIELRDERISAQIEQLNKDVILLLGIAHSPKVNGEIFKWYPSECEVELNYLNVQRKLVENCDVYLALKIIIADLASQVLPFQYVWKIISTIDEEELLQLAEVSYKSEREAPIVITNFLKNKVCTF